MRPAEVVDGGPVAQVRVLDDAELLEQPERPVDGRRVNVGVRVLDRLGDLVGREMARGCEQGVQDRRRAVVMRYPCRRSSEMMS